MANQKTVSSTVDDTKKLQAVIDRAGNTPTVFDFETDSIDVVSPVKIYSGTVFNGNGCLFEMMDNAPTTIFPSMTPIIGTKQSTTSNVDIFNVGFDGNSGNQNQSLGKGFHNFIGIQNGKNISVHGITVKDSLGDGSRLTNADGVLWYGNKIYRCGHDGLYIDGGANVEAWGNYVELRTNSAIRLRHVNTGYAHDNYIINKVGGLASSPGIQIEVSSSTKTCNDILIESNEVYDTNGPGVWLIGISTTNPNAAKSVTFRNNLFHNCGNMGAGANIPGVGGIICDGFDDVDISYNTFNRCKGYGVGFGQYVRATPSVSGLSATIFRNTFVNTVKANASGTYGGSPAARLVDRYPSNLVVMKENCLFNNAASVYRINQTGTIAENPLLDENSEPTTGSPCIKDGYTIGKIKPAIRKVMLKCEPEVCEKVKSYIPFKNQEYELI